MVLVKLSDKAPKTQKFEKNTNVKGIVHRITRNFTPCPRELAEWLYFNKRDLYDFKFERGEESFKEKEPEVNLELGKKSEPEPELNLGNILKANSHIVKKRLDDRYEDFSLEDVENLIELETRGRRRKSILRKLETIKVMKE